MTGTVRAGGGLLHKPRRLRAAALVVVACLLPHAAPAQPADSMLGDLDGLWAGHGTVNATRNGRTERVDCTLSLDWRSDIGRLTHELSCKGSGADVHASGYFDLIAATNRLTGFVNGSSIIGRARARCELKGRALHITMTQEEHDPRDALGEERVKRSVWILLLNRGDRRLGTVIKAGEKNAGGTYNKLAVTMRRVARRTEESPGAAETSESTPTPSVRRPVDERTVIER